MIEATFNNISALSWWSVLLVEETRVPVENNRPVVSHWKPFSDKVHRVYLAMSGVRTHNVSGYRHYNNNSSQIFYPEVQVHEHF